MAAVKQQVLNWLYSVLTSEYKDVNRTYSDVAQALSHYSSLSPRTDVYTYENGANALLLHISGILPVNYRGTTYRFPIALWVPHAYPRDAPLVYVTPAEGMAVRPGQHIDLQGKIYHPYLANWAEYWDKSNLLDFLAILRDVFAKEPPVVARQQAPTPARPISQVQSPPPIPPLPPGVGRLSSVTPASPRPQDVVQPPPPPPKPSHSVQGSISGPSRYETGPPLPPLPTQSGPGAGRYNSPLPPPQPSIPQHAPQRNSSLRYETAPPLPPQPHRQGSVGSPVSPLTPPQDQYQRPPYAQQYQQSQYVQGPIQSHPQQPQQQQLPPPTYNQQTPPAQWQNQPHQAQYPQHSQHPQQSQQIPPPQQFHRAPPPQQPKPAPPPIDLLSEPLTLPTPTSSTLTPPPIPPNPEKDLLLHNIARALASQRAHTASQTTSSLPGLAAQHRAMLTTLNSMTAELQSLESLSALLSSNTNILQSSLREADTVISSSQHRQAPNVDELLVAPTVVGNQLYETVCEERALGDTLFILGRAVERGRISPGTFARLTRSMSREWFLKKALVKKIGKGMGLNDGH